MILLHSYTAPAFISRLLSFCIVLFAAFDLLADEAQTESNSSIETGRDIYNFRCYFCHGYSGNAKTLASSFLMPPPRDFTSKASASIPREQMIHAVTSGRQGTAMVGFTRVLSSVEIANVIDFIRYEFINNHNINTRYHTTENGWPEHNRYEIAYPFATGEIPLDQPDEELSQAELKGKRLYLKTCITCHDRGHIINEGVPWSSQSLSYPRNNYSHKAASEGKYPTVQPLIDGITSASIHAKHDVAPIIENMTEEILTGKTLYEKNCAFCHAADGTGRNWIGSFLSPKPRDLTDQAFMESVNRTSLESIILTGIPGTSMPAWRNILSAQDISRIIDYISAGFHYVAE